MSIIIGPRAGQIARTRWKLKVHNGVSKKKGKWCGGQAAALKYNMHVKQQWWRGEKSKAGIKRVWPVSYDDNLLYNSARRRRRALSRSAQTLHTYFPVCTAVEYICVCAHYAAHGCPMVLRCAKTTATPQKDGSGLLLEKLERWCAVNAFTFFHQRRKCVSFECTKWRKLWKNQQPNSNV